MRNVGATEVRVRAALLRLWENYGEEFSRPSDAVRDEILRDEPGLDEWRTLDGVQRIGRKIAKGETGFSSGKWCELDDDVEFTYERGTFTVRRRRARRTRDRNAETKSARSRLRADRDPSPPAHLLAKPSPEELNRLDGRSRIAHDLREVAGLWSAAWSYGDSSEAITISAEDGIKALTVLEKERRGGPRVTQRHLDLMRRATGGALHLERNHYCAANGSPEFDAWTELVAMGLATEFAREPTMTTFNVTDSGLRFTYGDVRKPARKRAKR